MNSRLFFQVISLVGALVTGLSVRAAGPDAGDILRQQQEIERYKSLPKSIPKPITSEAPKKGEENLRSKFKLKVFVLKVTSNMFLKRSFSL